VSVVCQRRRRRFADLACVGKVLAPNCFSQPQFWLLCCGYPCEKVPNLGGDFFGAAEQQQTNERFQILSFDAILQAMQLANNGITFDYTAKTAQNGWWPVGLRSPNTVSITNTELDPRIGFLASPRSVGGTCSRKALGETSKGHITKSASRPLFATTRKNKALILREGGGRTR
jgi:hypothetical protein